MWPDADPDMTQAEFRAWQRKRLPPDDEMPRVIGVNADLVRSPESAVTLTHCLVYSRGISFRLTALFRVDDDGPASFDADNPIAAAIMPMAGSRQPDFLLRLDLADGTALRGPVGESTDGPYLVRHVPLSSHMSGFRTASWLTPLPPPGPLTVSVECASLGMESAAVTLDAAALRDTADGVAPLWNWDD